MQTQTKEYKLIISLPNMYINDIAAYEEVTHRSADTPLWPKPVFFIALSFPKCLLSGEKLRT